MFYPAREVETGRAHAHPDRVAGGEVAAQDPLRERVLELLLDRALERPRAVDRVESRLREPVARFRREYERDVAILEPLVQVLELDVDDLADVLGVERMEHDHV